MTDDAPPAATPASSPSDDLAREGARRMLHLAVMLYGLVTLFAVGYAAFSSSMRLGDVLGESGRRLPTLGHVLAAAGVGLGIVGLSRLAVRLWPAAASASDELARLLGPLRVVDALVLAAVSAFAEELLFRGALFPTLELWGTACLFGLVHVLPNRRLWSYPLFAFAAGLLLGLLRQGSGSVVPPMIAHFVVNFLNIWWLGRRARHLAEGAGD